MRNLNKMTLNELFKEYKKAVECHDEDLAVSIETLACKKSEKKETGKDCFDYLTPDIESLDFVSDIQHNTEN